MPPKRILALALLVAALSFAPPARAADWTMWGGSPSRNMINTVEKNTPTEWDIDAGTNVKWSAPLGSQTYGNPVVAGGRIFIGTNNGAERDPDVKGDKGVVLCLNEADGELQWMAIHDKLPAGRVNDWPEQGICSSASVVGDHVYYVSNQCQLVCADVKGMADGNQGVADEQYGGPNHADFIWVLDMIAELGVFPHNLATSSPLVVGDRIFIVTSNGVDEGHLVIPAPRAPSFICVDRNTGKVLWEDRSPGRNILHGQWSSPAYGKAGGREQVVFPGGDGWLYSFAPEDGKLLWKFDMNPKDSVWELGGRGTRNNIIGTPVFVDGVVYLGVGQDPEHGEGPGHLYAIDASKEGDVTESGRIWHYEGIGRTLSTASVLDGILYVPDLSGFLYCLDAKTGEELWQYDTLAAVWGSTMVVDGKVYLGDEDGDVIVLKHGRKLEEISEQTMNNAAYSTPVAANGVLYIANRSDLFALVPGAGK